MSNTFNTTPPQWVIDTPSATPLATDLYRIAAIVWVPGTAAVAGNECKVTDSAGVVTVFDQFATGASEDIFEVTYPRHYNAQGLTVPTLAAGKVYIYFR